MLLHKRHAGSQLRIVYSQGFLVTISKSLILRTVTWKGIFDAFQLPPACVKQILAKVAAPPNKLFRFLSHITSFVRNPRVVYRLHALGFRQF